MFISLTLARKSLVHNGKVAISSNTLLKYCYIHKMYFFRNKLVHESFLCFKLKHLPRKRAH